MVDSLLLSNGEITLFLGSMLMLFLLRLNVDSTILSILFL